MIYKLGSLFDGSGGFPLAGAMCGIEPTWAAEVEPYPIAVTRSRFDGDADTPLLKLARKHHPELKLISVHLGNVCEINGAEIEPVDIITFGSPCQDLSVAGKRAGLKHAANGDEETTRSGLFMEAVRIIKEMREATNGRYPTFALWENVPGAFSSNNGEDFRVVCEELIKIVEPTAVMPSVPKGGWAYADSYRGDGWSLAYRVFDAQYWGVPQRRRRIHLLLQLVPDIGGTSAREILFEREGLRGYFAKGRAPWKGTAPDAQNGAGADDCAGNCLNPWDYQTKRCYGIDGIFPTLSAGERSGQNQQSVCIPVVSANGEAGGRGMDAVGAAFGFDRYNQCSTGSVCETLRTPGGGDNYPTVCYGVTAKGNGDAFISEERHTSLSTGGGMPGQVCAAAMVPYTLKIRSGVAIDSAGKAAGKGPLVQVDKAGTLSAVQDQYLFAPTYALDQQGGKGGANYAENIMHTLCGDSHGTPHAVAYKTYDARGNGDGEIANTLTGDHNNRITDYTSVVVESAVVFDGSSVTSPINASNPQPGDPSHTLGTDSRNYVVAPIYCIDGDKVGKAERAGGSGLGIRPGDSMYTLTAKDVHGVCIPIHDQATRCAGKRGDKTDGKGNGLGVGEDGDPMNTLTAGDRHAVVYAVDQGGGKSSVNVSAEVSPTLCTTHYGEPAVAYGLDRASFNQGQNAKFDFSVTEEQQPTLVAKGPGAVAYGIGQGAVRDMGKLFIKEKSKTLTNGTCPGHHNGVVVAYGTDVGWLNSCEDQSPTLLARQYKDPHLVTYQADNIRYIVRRLTPTECARLQGFDDRWGDINHKDSFTDEEYRFWLDVRNTHAAINGKAVKDYTKEQMLKWYNNLHTDSAEYKMWGNGIALPPALYCMQGIAEALKSENTNGIAPLPEPPIEEQNRAKGENG